MKKDTTPVYSTLNSRNEVSILKDYGKIQIQRRER